AYRRSINLTPFSRGRLAASPPPRERAVGTSSHPSSGCKEEHLWAIAASGDVAIFDGSLRVPLRRDLTMFEAPDRSWQTELASRNSNGITVRLLWNRSTNLVTVAVADPANDDYFELVLDDRERALDVFEHPFAHAAARGVEFRAGRPEQA